MGEEDSRQKILLAAGRIFASKGFADAKIREICSEAKVNVAAVNYYFGDKENLYYEAVKLARQNRADEVPLPESDEGAETRLRQFVETLVDRVAGISEPPWEVQLILREVLFPTEACKRLIDEYFRPFFNQLLAIIEDLVPRKWHPGKLRAETAYRLGYSIVGQILYLRFTSQMHTMFMPKKMAKQNFQNHQIAEHVFQFSLGALRSKEFWVAVTRQVDQVTELTRR